MARRRAKHRGSKGGTGSARCSTHRGVLPQRFLPLGRALRPRFLPLDRALRPRWLLPRPLVVLAIPPSLNSGLGTATETVAVLATAAQHGMSLRGRSGRGRGRGRARSAAPRPVLGQEVVPSPERIIDSPELAAHDLLHHRCESVRSRRRRRRRRRDGSGTAPKSRRPHAAPSPLRRRVGGWGLRHRGDLGFSSRPDPGPGSCIGSSPSGTSRLGLHRGAGSPSTGSSENDRPGSALSSRGRERSSPFGRSHALATQRSAPY